MGKRIAIAVAFFSFTGLLFAQKMTVKDSENHVLMEVNDEGTVGSITLPDSTNPPGTTTNKLYNVNGALYWNGNALAQGEQAWSMTGNSGTTPGTNFLGTTDDQALEVKINNSRVARFEPNTNSPNVLMGRSDNTISGYGSVVSGGGKSGLPNSINGNYIFIGGGYYNQATGEYTVIGGGEANQARNNSATIGGGSGNKATNNFTTIAGGTQNTASGDQSTVGGGGFNTASGTLATVPGGHSNTALGSYSYAAGRRAKANHSGTFVWADGTDADFASNQVNSFIIRAGGGVGIGKNNPAQALDVEGTVQMTGFKMTTSPSAGYVLTSDASGVGTWQAAGGGGGGGWSLTGNSGTTPETNFIGTTDNQALEIKVNNIRTVRYEPNATSPNVISGNPQNYAKSDVFGATIAGGGATAPSYNAAYDHYGSIGGGNANQTGNNDGNPTNQMNATVGGGQNNKAQGSSSTISGGYGNIATGNYAIIPGGLSNSASADYCFSSGRRAKANHPGTFVWADGTDAEFPSNQDNSFIIRAGGGVGIGKNNPAQALDVEGTVQMTGFKLTTSPSAGYVLTSDASGVGTWQSIGSDGDWSISGSNIYANIAGNVGIGNPIPGYKLDVVGIVRNTGDTYITNALGVGSYNDGSVSKMVVNGIPPTGAATPSLVYDPVTGLFYYFASSKRYKENIENFNADFNKILDVDPKIYTDKTRKIRDIGFIAEEFDEAGLKELVFYDEEGKPNGLKYDRVPLYLLEIIKQQQERIEALEKKMVDISK